MKRCVLSLPCFPIKVHKQGRKPDIWNTVFSHYFFYNFFFFFLQIPNHVIRFAVIWAWRFREGLIEWILSNLCGCFCKQNNLQYSITDSGDNIKCAEYFSTLEGATVLFWVWSTLDTLVFVNQNQYASSMYSVLWGKNPNIVFSMYMNWKSIHTVFELFTLPYICIYIHDHTLRSFLKISSHCCLCQHMLR